MNYVMLMMQKMNFLGCPVSTQTWCSSSPALGIPEFVIGYFLGVIG